MKNIKIGSISYSPGYGDMLGGVHSSSLERDKQGKWICVCRDSNTRCDPTVITVFSVSEEKVEELEDFIAENDFLSLGDRPQSELFLTDYSPWSYRICYEALPPEENKRGYCSIMQFREYTEKDKELLNEMKSRFASLKGEKISETVEKPKNGFGFAEKGLFSGLRKGGNKE